MLIKNPITSICLWTIHCLTIPILTYSLYKSFRNEARNYTTNIILVLNFLFLLYPIFSLALYSIPSHAELAPVFIFLLDFVYHMTINWATALALFTYGVLNASGPFRFKLFLIWSVIGSIAVSLFSYFAIDQYLSKRTYLNSSLDLIVSIAPVVIIYTCYSKAYRLITSGKLGDSLYSNTSALKILWYSRITLICHAPNILNDILHMVVLATEKTPNSYIEYLFDCQIQKVFYSVWALLNLWVDWNVLRVYRERAITRISLRNSRGLTKSLLPDQDEPEYDFETFYQ